MRYEIDAAMDLVMAAKIKPSTKVVFWAILRCFGRNSHSWPGVRRIRSMTGIRSYTTIREAVTTLVEGGYLSLGTRPQGGRTFTLGATVSVALQNLAPSATEIGTERSTNCNRSSKKGTKEGETPKPPFPAKAPAKGASGSRRLTRAEKKKRELAEKIAAADVEWRRLKIGPYRENRA